VTRAVDCMMRATAVLARPPRTRSNETVVGDEGMLA
jgi:hypothetical protein